ncbi:hypothetical protein QP158_10845, partial [Streptococcus agalactiae]|uniref:hypothetical protein n=1 Tax=Streptococcus agalactiae TaxID=1311 RepID=UPI0025545A8A
GYIFALARILTVRLGIGKSWTARLVLVDGRPHLCGLSIYNGTIRNGGTIRKSGAGEHHRGDQPNASYCSTRSSRIAVLSTQGFTVYPPTQLTDQYFGSCHALALWFTSRKTARS